MDATSAGRGSLHPDPEAHRLAAEMTQARATMQTILEETVDSARKGQLLESGRTVCGDQSDVRAPLARFPRAVELARCPIGTAGLWHSHTTQRQLRHPEHSLADMGNVIFEGVDASVVVGTQSAEVLVAAADREAMLAAFQDALGAAVESTGDVLAVPIADPPQARQRVRAAMPGLFSRVPTSFPDLDADVTGLSIPASAPLTAHGHDHGAGAGAGHTHVACSTGAAGLTDVAGLRRQSREISRAAAHISSRLGLKSTTRDQATGIIIGQLISNFLGFG